MQKFVEAAFAGTLVTDFKAAHDAVISGDQQECLPHLLRGLLKVKTTTDLPENRYFSGLAGESRCRGVKCYMNLVFENSASS